MSLFDRVYRPQTLGQKIDNLSRRIQNMSDSVSGRLAHVEAALQKMGANGDALATSLQGVSNDVAAIKVQLDELRANAGGELSPANSAILDQLVADSDAALAKVDAAVTSAGDLKTTADGVAQPPVAPQPTP